MSWVINTENNIDGENLRHLHSEIRKARQFWYDKSFAYLNWYTSFVLAMFSAFFVLLTKKADFGAYLGLLTILPLIAVFLCHYARKSIKICYRQFLEHTAMMAKIDYMTGMFRTNDTNNNSPFFEEDLFISPQRHFDYIRKFKRENQFVVAELEAPERTYNYKLRILRMLQILAIFLVLVITVAGARRVSDVIKSYKINDKTAQRVQLDKTEKIYKIDTLGRKGSILQVQQKRESPR